MAFSKFRDYTGAQNTLNIFLRFLSPSVFLSSKQFPVERTIVDRFGNMMHLNALRVLKIGYRSRDF